MSVVTAQTLGYCFGISAAIDKAIKYANEHGKVYSLGTLAHNEDVVELLRSHGVEPIQEQNIEHGMNIAITAHGAPPELYRKIEGLYGAKPPAGCSIVDCTCSIVRKAQQVLNTQLDGFDILIFGDPDHQEVIGLKGWASEAKFVGTFNNLFNINQDLKDLKLGKKVGVVSQTTKVPAEFSYFLATLIHHNIGKIEQLRVFNTICPIVASRVRETEQLSEEVDMMLVVGSQESANTKNLATVARQIMSGKAPDIGAEAVFIVQNEEHVGKALANWFEIHDMALVNVGITAGTSTPMDVVERVVKKVEELLNGR